MYEFARSLTIELHCIIQLLKRHTNKEKKEKTTRKYLKKMKSFLDKIIFWFRIKLIPLNALKVILRNSKLFCNLRTHQNIDNKKVYL